jgi:hypothetical protein
MPFRHPFFMPGFGRREIDLVGGKTAKSALLTLTERTSRPLKKRFCVASGILKNPLNEGRMSVA